MQDTPDLESPEGYAANVIANAVRYTVSLFLGRGKYDTREGKDRAEAAALAEAIMKDHPKTSRQPVIMAFDAAGNSTVVSGEPHAAHKARPKPAPKAKRKRTKQAPAAEVRAPVKKAPPASHHGARWSKDVEAEWEANAAKGHLPPAPDFSAPTHANYRKMRDRMVAAAEKGDLAELQAIEVRPVSSSRTILYRYQLYAVKALEVRSARNAKRKAKAHARAASPELVEIERPS